MNGVSLPLAMLAGIVAFASPCFLPIVPVFVGYVAGDPDGVKRARMATLTQAVAFVSGFTLIFVSLWVSVGLVGYVVGDLRDPLRIIGGSVLIVLGLHVAGLIQIPFLERTLRAPLPGAAAGSAPTLSRSFLLGLAFGAGWTPCIGPVLGGVLGLATASDTVGQGALLLLAFSLGLGLPFIAVALGAGELRTRLGWLAKHHRAVSLVTGGLLIIIGFLMITNMFGALAGLIPALGI